VVCSETSEKVKVFDMIAVGCDVVTRERERERGFCCVCCEGERLARRMYSMYSGGGDFGKRSTAAVYVV
jgi:hypothetical protein